MVWPLVLLLSFGVVSWRRHSTALVAQGARPAVHAHGDGDMVAAQSIACRLRWPMREPPFDGDAGTGDHSMASQVRLVGVRRHVGAGRSGMTIGVAETAKPRSTAQTSTRSTCSKQRPSSATSPASRDLQVAASHRTARPQRPRTQRFAKQGWPYLILIVVLCVRLIQCIWLIAERDPVVEALTALLWASALVAAFAVVGLIVLRLSRRAAAPSSPNWATSSAESASPSAAA